MTSSDKQSAKLTPISFILWGQAIIIVLGAFASMLSSTMLNTALPSIAASLHTSSSIAQWIATGYFLSLAAGVPLSAWLSRKLGPTKLWLISLVLFMVFSILCAESRGIYMLIICRVLQGLSGGLLVPAGQTITSIAAGPKRLGRVMSIVGIAVVVAPTLGTTLSSAILSKLSWPWLFWINIPLGLVAFFAGLKWLPKIEVTEAGKFDWIGFLFVLSGVPLLIYGVTSIGNTVNAVPIGASIITGAVLIIGFVVRSLKRDKPLLQLRLFGNGVFSVAAVVMFLGGAINFGAQMLLPHYLTDVRHLSLMTASQLILPQVIGTAVGFPLAGRFTDRYGAGRLIFTGSIIMMISMLSLVFIGVNTGTTWVALVFFIWGLGTALATIPAMTAGLTTVASDQIPDSAPILNMLQRIGASIGTALITLLYTKNLTSGLDQAHTLVVFKNVVWLLSGSILVLLISSLTLVIRENKNSR